MKRYEIEHTEDEWRRILTPDRYAVLRDAGTERSFSGAYVTLDEEGLYRCAACGNPLFASGSKFDAGCGWPSFTATVSTDAVEERLDTSHGMRRTEIRCRRCGSHLGHVFDDGPAPTGLRYCMNSVALDFEPSAE